MFIEESENANTGDTGNTGQSSGNAAEGQETKGQEETGQTEQTGQEGKEQEGGNGEQKSDERIPITEEMRQRLNIPDKFKYLDDVVKWGSEAEKQKSKIESEKARYERQLEEQEAMIAEMEQSLDKAEQKGDISPEEKEKIIEQFQIDFAKDPITTMNKLFNAFERRLTEQKNKETYESQWAKEDEQFRKEYGEEWDKTIRPEIAKISAKRPYLKSIEELVAVYERQKNKVSHLNKADTEEKRTQKTRAFSESAGGTPKKEGDIYDKIAKAKTIAELEEASKGIPKSERQQ